MNKLLIKIIILVILVGSIFTLLKVADHYKTKSDSQNLIISQLESSNYSLQFTNGDLEEFINLNNTEMKHKIDSITKANNIKLKNIKKIINVSITDTLTDTIFIASEPLLVKDSTNYHSAFSMDSNCFKLAGVVISSSPNPVIRIDKLDYDNETFSFVYKESRKWWQIFKKRKLMMKTVTKCGVASTKELEVKD